MKKSTRVLIIISIIIGVLGVICNFVLDYLFDKAILDTDRFRSLISMFGLTGLKLGNVIVVVSVIGLIWIVYGIICLIKSKNKKF